jgi:hypothetical protein
MKRMVLIVLALACGKSRAPAAGSTGAFAIVTVEGKQKMYLPLIDPTFGPQGVARMAVVDVGIKGNGAAGAPAQIGIVLLGAGSVRLTGGDETIVIASGGPKVWFIDPRSDAVVKSLTVTTPGSSFSGGGGYVTGIAADSGNRRAVLAVGNGFAIVDLDKKEIARTIVAAPSENFGYDSVAQRIVAPFYACPSTLDICGQYKTPSGATIYDGLNVIDLRDDTVYTFQDPSARRPEYSVGWEPDSAAVDPGTGQAIVPSEMGTCPYDPGRCGGSTLLDLAHAAFDKASRTFTAPHKNIATGVGLTGVAIEPSRHYAFWEEESGALVAVADLSHDISLVTGEVPSPPGSTAAWRNMGDPHGIAVATSIASGKSVGFVVNAEQRWIARIDFESMLATHSPNPLGPAEMAPFVTFLDANPP